MTDSGREQILSHVSDSTQKDISDIFKRIDAGKEFEFIFFSKKGHQMNKEKYVLLLKYMRNMSRLKKLKLAPPEKTLDIGYTASMISNNKDDPNPSTTSSVFRISIEGANDINKMLRRLNDIQNKNYVIYKFLLHVLSKDTKNESISFMMKSREVGDTVDMDDISTRVRLSSETDLTKTIRSKKPKINDNLDKLMAGEQIDFETRQNLNDKIFFRLKERTSLFIEETDDHFIRIDLTDTKTTKDIHKLNTTVSNYELEIEYGATNAKAVNKSHLNTLYSTAESLLKLIQQSQFIIGSTQSAKVIQYYKDMTNADGNISNLVARQPVSLEIQHTTEYLPDKYAVTDKADGDRYFLIIYNSCVYLISTNLIVKDTGIVLDKKLEKYNGTILDGEYIFIAKERRHVYMTFDCLRSGATDIRSMTSFMGRMEIADKIIEDCFILKGQTGFKYKTPPTQKEEFNINEISKFYGQELQRFYGVLNKDIEYNKEYPLIRRKFFMPVFGAKRWEIFRYSVEFWSKYTEDSNVKFPYLLDGLIYQPLEQAYVTNVHESKNLEYKWKPPTKNSIDFYIEFKKDPQTGKIMDVYDNSLSSDTVDGSGETGTIRNKTYRICTLFCGKTVNNREHPVPFEQNYGVSDAYIYLKDGDLRDISGDIISDKTVVEFYYINDPSIAPPQRWVPIKTRYDKTESVEKHGKRYGNYSGTADKIWRSMINPVIMDDFIELAKGNTQNRNFYDIKIKEMNSKISRRDVAQVNKENKYYQKVTKIASTMRQYHNFIKSNLIYTYCNKMYQSNAQQSVLDIGCGRGGDIGKFYYTEVAYLVGIDIDAEGFKSPVDGAISRYNAFRKKKPNFPKMYFIQADARALFDYESQIKCLSGMEDVNKKLLQKFFPSVDDESHHKSLFDRIDCQFAMHYFLKDNLSWNNFKQNLKNHLRGGGYFIATAFDSKEVIKAIGNKDAHTVYYDDSDGNKKKFFEIVKRYDADTGNKRIETGSAIDVFMSWAFDEGTYQTEYLVDFEFVKEDFAKDVDLELVDSDLFSNQLEVHKKFIQDATQYESSDKTKIYMAEVAQYYDDNEMNAKCLEYTNLHRYFVFRKKAITDSDISKGDRKKQKGGETDKKSGNDQKKQDFAEKYDFSDMKQFKIPEMTNYDDKYSMVNSIHKILVSHSILPKSLHVNEFVSDLGMNLVEDHEVSGEYVHDITKKAIINNEIMDEKGGAKIQKVLDGLNIFFVERDCNDFYDITYSAKKNSKGSDRAVILMKEGNLYKPLLRKENKGIRGIFRLKDEMVSYLMENGEEL
jgi:SAM-dependent methyltransferase